MGTFEVELTVGATDLPLKSGFIAAVDIQPSAAADYVEIPAAALVEGDGRRGSCSPSIPRSKRRCSARGSASAVLDSTVVLDRGLAPGARVVTTGAVGLRDGETVRVSNDE